MKHEQERIIAEVQRKQQEETKREIMMNKRGIKKKMKKKAEMGEKNKRG